jgi:hypothetical protein
MIIFERRVRHFDVEKHFIISRQMPDGSVSAFLQSPKSAKARNRSRFEKLKNRLPENFATQFFSFEFCPMRI